MSNRISSEKSLLLFDGVCNLCNGFVQFVIEQDPQAKFRFASLQSETGQRILEEMNMPATDLKTVILRKNGRIYTHSDVALEVAKELGGIWSLVYVGKILPKALRDKIYDWVAANRYRWFGKQESCWLPSPELQERFVE